MKINKSEQKNEQWAIFLDGDRRVTIESKSAVVGREGWIEEDWMRCSEGWTNCWDWEEDLGKEWGWAGCYCAESRKSEWTRENVDKMNEMRSEQAVDDNFWWSV